MSLKKPFFRPYLAAETLRGEDSLHLVKPLTYMNRSGEILPALLRRALPEETVLIVVTDNMDLPPGRVRMKPRGSSAGHNGIKSLMAHWGSGEFYRLYVGVGRPAPGNSVVDHVLGTFPEKERNLVDQAVKTCSASLLSLGSRPLEQVLNEINSG